jgi:hypothetical protein
MRNKNEGQPEFLLQVLQQVQYLCLDRNVERRHGFVTDNQVRLQRQRAGDTDTLPLPTRETVRVTIQKTWVETHQAHQLGRHFALIVHVAELVHHQRFAQNIEHRHARIECAIGVLKYKLHLAAKFEQRGIVERAHIDLAAAVMVDNLTLIRRYCPHNDLAERGFAATAFAYQAEAFAALDFQRHPIDRQQFPGLGTEPVAAMEMIGFADLVYAQVRLAGVGKLIERLLPYQRGCRSKRGTA